jgi:uncharacterized protein YgfB (UPF0149 family)
MDVIVNNADTSEEWVRGFLLRLGYHLAAEYQFMPECELKQMVGEHANDLIDMADLPDQEPPPPTLRAV